MISARNITYAVKSKALLRNISVDLQPGEITAFIGPNGAGKSTLIQLLGGFITNYYGAVHMNDKPLRQYSFKELACVRAFIPQRTDMHISFSVRDVIAFGGYAQPHSETAFGKALLGILLNELHLDGLAEQPAHLLSGGELQRVMLAKALYQLKLSPTGVNKYLFLDEPANHLDLKHQQALLAQLKLLRNQGFGIAIVLHDLHHVRTLADRVFCLDNGQIVASGAAHEVLTTHVLCTHFGLSTQLINAHPHWLGAPSAQETPQFIHHGTNNTY